MPKGSVTSYRVRLVIPSPLGRRLSGAPVYATNILGPVSLDLEVTLATDAVFTLDGNDYEGDTKGWIDFAANSMDLRNRVLIPVSHLGYRTPTGATDKEIQVKVDAGGDTCRVVETSTSLTVGKFVSLMDELKLVKSVTAPSGGRVDVTFTPPMLQDVPVNTELKMADPTGAFLPSGDERRLTVDRVVANTFLAGETHVFLQYGPTGSV